MALTVEAVVLVWFGWFWFGVWFGFGLVWLVDWCGVILVCLVLVLVWFGFN